MQRALALSRVLPHRACVQTRFYRSFSTSTSASGGDNYAAAEVTRPSWANDEEEYGMPLRRTKLPARERFCTGPYEQPGTARPNYPKRRSPFARAKALINALHQEEGMRMILSGRAVLAAFLPPPRPGDVLRVDFGEVKSFTGIVMSVRKRGLGSGIVLRNVIDGVAVERAVPLYDPSVTNVERVAKRRKVRRNKLYYLREKKLKESTFTHAPRNKSS